MAIFTPAYNHLKDVYQFGKNPHWQKELDHLRQLAEKKEGEEFKKAWPGFIERISNVARAADSDAAWKSMEKFALAIAKATEDTFLSNKLRDIKDYERVAKHKELKNILLTLSDETLNACQTHLKELMKNLVSKNDRIQKLLERGMNNLTEQASSSMQQAAYSPEGRFAVNLVAFYGLLLDIMSVSMLNSRAVLDADDEGNKNRINFLPGAPAKGPAH